MIPNVENGGILRDIFTPVYDNFRACKPKTDLKCIHDHGLGFLCPAVFLSGFIPVSYTHLITFGRPIYPDQLDRQAQKHLGAAVREEIIEMRKKHKTMA